MKNTLYIITGSPASGKTTLANKLSRQLGLPILSKDTIKEILFDDGTYSKQQYQQFDTTSYDLLFYFTNILLGQKISFILESNFKPHIHNAFFKKLQKKYSIRFIQILCIADTTELLRRYIERAHSNKRHPGHGDKNNINNVKKHFTSTQQKQFTFLDIPSRKIKIDTTSFRSVKIKAILGNELR